MYRFCISSRLQIFTGVQARGQNDRAAVPQRSLQERVSVARGFRPTDQRKLLRHFHKRKLCKMLRSLKSRLPIVCFNTRCVCFVGYVVNLMFIYVNNANFVNSARIKVTMKFLQTNNEICRGHSKIQKDSFGVKLLRTNRSEN